MKRKQKITRSIILDILIVLMAYCLIAWCKDGSFSQHWDNYSSAIGFFVVLWISLGLLTGKFKRTTSYSRTVKAILSANALAVAIVMSLIYYFELHYYSRLMVFGTIGSTTLIEFLAAWLLVVLEKSKRQFFYEGHLGAKKARLADDKWEQHIRQQYSHLVQKGIIDLSGEETYHFINDNLPFDESQIYFTATRSSFNIANMGEQHQAIVNMQTLNDVADLNKLFNICNEHLPEGGYLFAKCETIIVRRLKIMDSYPPIINKLVYALDFLYNRIFAKLYPTHFIYRWLNHRNKALSKTELLGRLYASGFVMVAEEIIDGAYVCIVQKDKAPINVDNQAIGVLIRLRRKGKGGKPIAVYKFRTMYIYSEYLQEYVHSIQGTSTGDKLDGDFRVNSYGAFLRRFWLDELPMFINFFKGDLKLVGVRPLSYHKFSTYPLELQELRSKHKPGLIPPYYADLPKDQDEMWASEDRYLKSYEKNPLKTDFIYLYKTFVNIVFRGARSS